MVEVFHEEGVQVFVHMIFDLPNSYFAKNLVLTFALTVSPHLTSFP